ncbi:Fe(3+)-hydroxamate ABC transporter permease FhuB [Marinobacter adhaerens]|jgi:iron complex transport system permease protein|uniref:Fe(3+)-hydroxamate ABC transporter permease FhuB n=1 Tax=Marinobacter adhaerens TaxID=1033846 RepID=A0ABX8IN97_9GAMM|nr:Fe(3+)-hydroxamate ABC transporter permease FhuB [Marinobacter adhaerens]MBW4979408.1 Fe(3+)-hydroxamate ABC transporter permease FhuB [Marinobacter adhaerens]QWV14578.1 Fe(3+)-hydroxamate ABC transporter permease FhuB [Marinobacter adhaerens]
MYAESANNPVAKPSLPARLPVAAALIWCGAFLASAAPWLGQLNPGALIAAFWTFEGSDYASVLAHYSWAPRVAIAVLIGFGLGLAGAVTQQILGNPLASPTTLGVEAGGQFGITVATMFFPGLLAFSPDLVAVSGGLLAIGLVIALTWRLGFSPVTVILAGLVVTFFLGAVNMAFLLLKGEWLGNLFIWGAGSLVQNNWQPFMELWPRVLVLGVFMVLLMRPLQIMQLGQTSARSLGAKVGLIRVLALFLVVLMSATVVSRVGVVAFIGLAAPVLARLLGARTLSERLIWSSLLGAGLLLLADTLAHWASTRGDGSLVPTGTTTALIGGPIILLALQSLKNTHHMPGQDDSPAGFLPKRRSIFLTAGGIAALLLATIVISMGWSPGLDEWSWTPTAQWHEAWVWRGPRLLAAILAGVALGLAGTLIQRMTGNPMASPEMLGISGGAAVVMVLIVLLGADIGRAGQLGAATLGAAAALGLLIMLARKHRFAGNQLLLGGLALYVFMDAGLRLVMASGGTVASQLLNWMYGSTWLVSEVEALGLLALIVLISAGLLVIIRPLSILPLGETSASSLGLPVTKVRLMLLLLAALLTASATVVIGPLSFVGLIAPHLARVLGQQTVGRQLVVAALAGGLLLGMADYLSRIVVYPNQLPAGLLAALVGGLYFLWGLSRHGRA